MGTFFLVAARAVEFVSIFFLTYTFLDLLFVLNRQKCRNTLQDESNFLNATQTKPSKVRFYLLQLNELVASKFSKRSSHALDISLPIFFEQT